MFEKLIAKALKSMTPEEKAEFRKSLDADLTDDNDNNPADKVDETKGNEETNAQNTDGENAPVGSDDNGTNNQEQAPATEQGAPQVTETPEAGNGVRVEDLVTKDELAERLAALDAKLQAVLKENQDLKDKYENPDFGTAQKKGVGDNSGDKRKPAYTSFDEYAKDFM